MKKVYQFSAFTLIELLVVVAIISLFFFLALAAYQSFNKSQALISAAHEVKSALRDAQNRAISGEKDSLICQGLEGWKFTILPYDVSTNPKSNIYLIQGVCNNGITFSTKNYKLPNTDGLKFKTTGEILFKPVNGTIVITPGTEICIKSDSNTSYKIDVNTSGGISEKKFSTSNNCT